LRPEGKREAFSPALLISQSLCNEAALMAARANRKQVAMEDFEGAGDKILLEAERRVVMTPADRCVTACHESGHVLVAWLTPAADPVRKVSIVPHGRALGVSAEAPPKSQRQPAPRSNVG
jgi:cell division protease FtsH